MSVKKEKKSFKYPKRTNLFNFKTCHFIDFNNLAQIPAINPAFYNLFDR